MGYLKTFRIFQTQKEHKNFTSGIEKHFKTPQNERFQTIIRQGVPE